MRQFTIVSLKIFAFFFAFLLVSCNPNQEQAIEQTAISFEKTQSAWTPAPPGTQTATVTQTNTAKPSNTPTHTKTNTATITPSPTTISTQTPTPTRTSTLAPFDFSLLPGKLVAMGYECLPTVSMFCTDLYLMDPDLQNPVNITKNSGGLSIKPKWSPDGQYILYEHFITGENGMIQLRLVVTSNNATMILTPQGINGLSGFSFSPDGRYLVYGDTGPIPDTSDLFIIDLRTLQISNLTNREEGYDAFPAWFKNGSQIAFTSDRPLEGHSDSTGLHIWSMKPDGTEVSLLVPTKPDQQEFMPIWSPRGDRIAYYRGATMEDELFYGEELWTFNLEYGSENQVFVLENGFTSADPPAWSPDGLWLGVSTGDDENRRIRIHAEHGVNEIPIDVPNGINDGISWSPDSNAFIYSFGGNDEEDSKFYLVILYPEYRVYPGPGSLEDANWSPFD
jgi:Tol biopolymer transport system component